MDFVADYLIQDPISHLVPELMHCRESETASLPLPSCRDALHFNLPPNMLATLPGVEPKAEENDAKAEVRYDGGDLAR